MTHKEYLELLIGPLANEGGGGTPAVLITKNISANGTYDASDDSADGYSEVVVSVQPDLQSKSVTIQQNGTTNITPDQGKDGLSAVQVDVSVQPDLQAKSVTIQQNGQTVVSPDSGKDGLSSVEVNVSVPSSQQTLNDFAYLIFNKTVTSLADSTDPNVPRVTHLYPYSLREQQELLTVDYPNVTVVDAYNLYDCPKLREVRLASCTEVKGGFCYHASALETLYLPSCKTVNGAGLSLLQHLRTLDLSSLEVIASNNFSADSSSSARNNVLTELSLPKMQTLGPVTFQYFNALTKVTFGSDVSSIGASAFRYDAALNTVIFGAETAAVPTLGTSAFAGTAIASGNGYFYVPDALLTTWKAASNWSTYAAQIKGLSELPS